MLAESVARMQYHLGLIADLIHGDCEWEIEVGARRAPATVKVNDHSVELVAEFPFEFSGGGPDQPMVIYRDGEVAFVQRNVAPFCGDTLSFEMSLLKPALA